MIADLQVYLPNLYFLFHLIVDYISKKDQVNKSEKSLNELRLEKRNLEIENDNLERKERFLKRKSHI